MLILSEVIILSISVCVRQHYHKIKSDLMSAWVSSYAFFIMPIHSVFWSYSGGIVFRQCIYRPKVLFIDINCSAFVCGTLIHSILINKDIPSKALICSLLQLFCFIVNWTMLFLFLSRPNYLMSGYDYIAWHDR